MPNVSAKSFEIESINIDAYVQDDGSMEVVETFTYDFSGDFTYVYKTIPKSGFNSLTVTKAYNQNGEYKYCDVESAGCFVVYETNDAYEIGLVGNYSNSSYTYTIEYTLTDVITKYNDVAELYWKFVGDEIDQHVGNVKINIYLPNETSQNNVRAWGHGPLNGNVVINSDGSVALDVTNLSKNTFVEARVAFPREMIVSSNKEVNQNRLDDIIAEETKWADDANQQRLISKIAVFVISGGSILALVFYEILAFMVKRKAKPYIPKFSFKYNREIDKNRRPVEVGLLLNFYAGKDITDDLMSTVLMDLCNRRYLELEFINKKEALFIISDRLDTELYSYDKLVFEFVKMADTDKDSRVSMDDINRYIKKHEKQANKFFDSFTASYELYKVSIIDKVLDKIKTKELVKLFAFSLIAILFVMGSLLLPDVYIMPIIASVSLLLVTLIQNIAISTQFKRLSIEAQEEYASWQAFRNFLTDLTLLKESELPELDKWEEYLVYATAIGVAKQVLKKLPILYPQLNDQDYMYTNRSYYPYIYMHMYNRSFSNGVSGFGKSVVGARESYQAALSSDSSGGGFGGGFSGGGGGGGGGGGMGAR